jgi:hypothetical protein
MPDLQRSKPELEAQQTAIVKQIQEPRLEARNYSLRCQQTHEVQDQKEALRRRNRIATLQTNLMKVQAELGEVNRSIRAQKPSSQIAQGRERARRGIGGKAQ